MRMPSHDDDMPDKIPSCKKAKEARMENNFPHELAIKPSVDARGLYDEHFIKLQESAIRSSGIAGRLWCEGPVAACVLKAGDAD